MPSNFLRSTAMSGRSGFVLMISVLLAGCATLPADGPTGADIRRDVRGSDNVMGAKIIDIDAQTISSFGRPDTSFSTLATLQADGRVDTLGPGDVLSIDVYEVGTGLFSGGRTTLGGSEDAATVPSANGSVLGSDITVDRNGAIFVPYVGRIVVAGLTPEQVQDKVIEGLKGKSQSPQVVVSLRKNVANTAVIMGAINRPGRVQLDLSRDRLLDAVAEAGGITANVTTGASTATGTGPQDMVIRFSRAGQTLEQPLDTIRSGSPDDLLLLPGDRIEVIRQPRTFTVFGALDRISQMPFESQRLSLAEALARAGGPSDARADPRAIFVFRILPDDTRVSAGDGASAETPHRRAVIYRLNMMRASGFLLAQEFAMHDKDVLYISNAASNRPTKLVQILNLLFTPVFSVAAVARF